MSDNPKSLAVIYKFAKFCGFTVSEDESFEKLTERVMFERHLTKEEAVGLVLEGQQAELNEFYEKRFGRQ